MDWEKVSGNWKPFERGKDEVAVVERVVPGRLVYVRTDEAPKAHVHVFKLDKMLIRGPDGSCRPYRGEPLSDLGVVDGKKVVVWGVKLRDVEPTLVVDEVRPRAHGLAVNIATSVATSVSSAVQKIFTK